VCSAETFIALVAPIPSGCGGAASSLIVFLPASSTIRVGVGRLVTVAIWIFALENSIDADIQVVGDNFLDNTYNARVSVQVIEGAGRITAYASVIDAKTQDPTLIQAQ